MYQYDFFQYNGANFNKVGNVSVRAILQNTTSNYTLSTSTNTLASPKLVSVDSSKTLYATLVVTSIFQNDGSAIVVNFLAALGLSFAIGFAGFVFTNQNNPVIKRSSPLFCGIMLLGISIIYMDLFMWAGPQNQALCITKVWLPILGFGILMGPMLAKTCKS